MQYVGVLVSVLVAACSSSHGVAVDAEPAVDAMPDAEACPPDVQVDGCVFDGLAGLPFDGTTPWTWTGTRSDGQQTSPFSTTLYLLRQGCSLQQSNAPIASPGTGIAITDTMAAYHDSAELPHPHTDSGSMCVSSADNALHYTQDTVQMEQMSIDFKTTGILTHP